MCRFWILFQHYKRGFKRPALSGLEQLVSPLMELVSTFKALVRVLVRECNVILFKNALYSTGWVGSFGRSNVRNVKTIRLQSLTCVETG